MKKFTKFAILLVIFLSTQSSVLCKTDKPSSAEIRKTGPHPVIARMRMRLDSISFYLFSHSFTRRSEFLEKIKEEVKDFEMILAESYKITPMEEKAKLKRLNELFKEVAELSEELSDMEEMLYSNVSEAIHNTLKAREYLKDEMDKNHYSISKEKEYDDLARCLTRLEADLMETLSNALFFLKSGRADMKSLAVKARMSIESDLEEYLLCKSMMEEGAPVKKKEKKKVRTDEDKTDGEEEIRKRTNLEKYSSAAAMNAQDAMEDYEAVRDKTLIFMDKARAMDSLIDTIVVKQETP